MNVLIKRFIVILAMFAFYCCEPSFAYYNMEVIDAGKMQFEVTKDGVLILPFKMNSMYLFGGSKASGKNKEFPINADTKTVQVKSCYISNFYCEKDAFDIDILYGGLIEGLKTELEIQLLNDKKEIIYREKIDAKIPTRFLRGCKILYSGYFIISEINIGSIKHIGILAE